MARDLLLIHLNPNGNPDIPIAHLLQHISGLDSPQIVVAGTPGQAMMTAIEGYRRSGISVEVRPKLTLQEDQELTYNFNVTAIMPARA